jgi:predicted enzyme related to lactoylglutathione lyase
VARSSAQPLGAKEKEMGHHAKMEHAELVSKDPAATHKFLEKAFGMKFTHMQEMAYWMHGANEGAVEGSLGIRAPMGPESAGTVSYITVPDIDEAIKSVLAAGAKMIMPKTEIPGMGWSAVYIAPGEVTQGLYQNK